jgi:hypothetical protein
MTAGQCNQSLAGLRQSLSKQVDRTKGEESDRNLYERERSYSLFPEERINEGRLWERTLMGVSNDRPHLTGGISHAITVQVLLANVTNVEGKNKAG